MSPRWDADQNSFVEGRDVTAVASAARIANGDSGWLNSSDVDELVLTLTITAVGGDADETLDVLVETASDLAGANTRTLASFAQKTQPGGATTERKTFGPVDEAYRVRWTVGGTTPSFTFKVDGYGK